MQHSFVICIDESGDQGFTFTGKNISSSWFVLAAVVTPVCNVSHIQNAVTALKSKIGCHYKKPIHFKRLKSDDSKRLVIASIGHDLRDSIRCVVVMVHKPCLSYPETFQERNRLYFYFTRYLLERASWVCAGSREYMQRAHGDGTAKVLFSSMSEMSREQIKAYFCKLQHMETSINWNVIRPNEFESLAPNRHAGLQVADCVASAFYCNEHPVEKRRTDEWSATLKPTVYRSIRGQYRGYGLKLFPASL